MFGKKDINGHLIHNAVKAAQYERHKDDRKQTDGPNSVR